MTKALLLCLLLPAAAHAQSFSAGKNLHELRQAVYAGTEFRSVFPVQLPEQPVPIFRESSGVQPVVSRIFLPKWTSEELPLFCKIEHKMSRRMAVPLKFRLGSVEYVDQLEYPGRWSPE